MRKKRIKELETVNFTLEVEYDYVWLRSTDFFEVYKLEKFLNGMKADLAILNTQINFVSFSTNHLSVFTSNKDLKVYKISSKPIKRIACLFLNHNLECLFSNEKFINTKFENKLLTFELIFE